MTKSSRGMCGRKRRFTEDEADRRARKFGQRAYHCTSCHGWHCTKQIDRPTYGAHAPETRAQMIGRARAALAELERKNVKGALLEMARANLDALLSKGRAA